MSFHVSRSNSFRELLAALSGKDIELPGGQVFQTTLKNQYDEQKQLIIEAMSKSRKVCTTSDAWTKGGKSFLGVTAHYIDETTLKRYSFLLAFRRIFGRSTYDVLGKLMYDIHNEFGLNVDKITHTVTDGGSNYCKAFRIYGTETAVVHTEVDSDQETTIANESAEEGDNDEDDYEEDDDIVAYEIDMNKIQGDYDELDPVDKSNEIENSGLIEGAEDVTLPKQMRCCSHRLNNVTSRDFQKNLPKNTRKALRSCMRKLHRVWGLVRRSTLAREIVQRVCGRMLVIPNNTRWNALFDASVVVLSLREKVNNFSFKFFKSFLYI